MRSRFRSLAGLSLAILIALGSVTMSLARGQMRDAAGSIVLCTGSGPVSVAIGADGEPVGLMPICPDCAFGLFEAPGAEATSPALARTATQACFGAERKHWRPSGIVFHRARGPPSPG